MSQLATPLKHNSAVACVWMDNAWLVGYSDGDDGGHWPTT